jgi:hypothetical protein
MAITSQSFDPTSDLPVDAGVGANPNHNYWQTGEVVGAKPGVPAAPGVAALPGQLVAGEVPNHQHGVLFNADDPKTSVGIPKDATDRDDVLSAVIVD